MSTVLLNKKNIIRGLVITIRKYRDNTINHKLDDCKLCQMYYNGKVDKCKGCLNSIFKIEGNTDFPCILRGDIYPKLSFYDSNADDTEYSTNKNNQYIADFWSEVLEVVKVTKPNDLLELSEGFRLKVSLIAEKYKEQPISTGQNMTSKEPEIVIGEVPENLLTKLRNWWDNW